MTDPRLSIVIPTYQRRASVLATLRTLYGEVPADDRRFFEVIVVVDGSTDGTKQAVRTLDAPYRLVIVEQSNKGGAAARNRGAERAQGRFVLFIDDDMRAGPGLVAAHLAALEAGAGATVGRMTLDDESPDTLLGREVAKWSDQTHERLSAAPDITDPDDVLGGNLGIDRALFFELGGFGEAFTEDGRYGNEDLDLGRRLLERGVPVRYVADGCTAQYYMVTASEHVRQMYDLGITDLLLVLESTDGHVGPAVREAKWCHPPGNPLARLAWQLPRLTNTVLRPHRSWVCRKVDAGRNDRRTRRWYRIHRGVAYRAGRASAPADVRRRVREIGPLPRPWAQDQPDPSA